MTTERKTGIKTTTIGSYPKPDYAPITGWFNIRDLHRQSPTRTYSAFLRNRTDNAAELLNQATREVVREQVKIGIDIPTGGEVQREHYIYYHLRHIEGFDFDNLTVATMRDGSWEAEVPTVVAPLRNGPSFLPQDWRVAQSSTDRPVKITLPGPLTIIDSTANAFYESAQDLAFALADVLAVEIGRLGDAGCRWIQVDEPLFARSPDKALAYGMEALDRCFAKATAGVSKAVHIVAAIPQIWIWRTIRRPIHALTSTLPRQSTKAAWTPCRSRTRIGTTTLPCLSSLPGPRLSWASSTSPKHVWRRPTRSAHG